MLFHFQGMAISFQEEGLQQKSGNNLLVIPQIWLKSGTATAPAQQLLLLPK